MKVPISWLKEYVDFSHSPQELAEVLTLAGVEVEGIERIKGNSPSGREEIILEIALTPNLGHCMSIFGLARELSALLDLPLKKVSFSFTEEGEPIEQRVHVSIVDRKQCLTYACRIVSGIRVGPSPDWLKDRLEMCGVRSINNVVDVSNLVMLEYGQPLHIFDYDKIAQKKIIVNAQTAFSTLETLDEQVRPIPPESLLICDGEKPLAFAGVMGGKYSAVSDSTQTVLIESAYFTAQAIRKSSKWLALRTEAAQRFEKGIDPNGVIEALNYSAYRLQEVAGGHIAPGAIDEKVHEFHPKKVLCRTSRVNALLGTKLSMREAADLLARLGIHSEEGQNEFVFSIPTWRNDINIEEDLIEEIARLYGYNNIDKPIPVHASSTLPQSPLFVCESEMRTRLIAQGLQEFLNCDLVSPSQEKMLSENTLSDASCISVLKPKSAEQSVLRTSLLPGLLQVIKYNIDHYQRDIAGFEIGRIYFKQGEQFIEQAMVGIVLSGKRAPYHWDPKPEECDFFDLKGIVENMFNGLSIEGVRFEPSHLHNFHPGRQAYVKVGDGILGVIGEVHPSHIEKLDIGQRVLFTEWNLQSLMMLIPQSKNVVDSPLFPGSERDWTITVKEELPLGRILDVIQKASSPILEKVSLLDLYKSDQIGKDKKNATFRFFYRDPERTLAFETVEREHARIIQAVLDEV